MNRSILFCACAMALAASVVLAQSRKELTISTKSLSVPGRGTNVSQFSDYSNGLGGSTSIYGSSSHVLSSSMTNPLGGAMSGASPFSYAPKGGAAGGATGGLFGGAGQQPLIPNAQGGGQLYKGADPLVDQGTDGPGGVESLLNKRQEQPLAVIFGDNAPRVIDDKSDKLVKSMVPDAVGLYHDYLQSGEKSFRDGDYSIAITKFQMANYIGRNDPESILSIAHAQFAANGYAQAAYRLRQALKVCPRLAVVRLVPKAFYGDPSVYIQNVQQLDEYLAKMPGDSDALLLRTYYAWFDTDERNSTSVATECLRKALATDDTPENTQAVEAFWAGMVASGRVKGDLKVRTQVKSPSGPGTASLTPARAKP